MLYCSRTCEWDLFVAESYWDLVIISLLSMKEGTCLEVLDSVEEKKIPMMWLKSLREDFLLHKNLEQTVLKVGASISAKESQTIGGED